MKMAALEVFPSRSRYFQRAHCSASTLLPLSTKSTVKFVRADVLSCLLSIQFNVNLKIPRVTSTASSRLNEGSGSRRPIQHGGVERSPLKMYLAVSAGKFVHRFPLAESSVSSLSCLHQLGSVHHRCLHQMSQSVTFASHQMSQYVLYHHHTFQHHQEHADINTSYAHAVRTARLPRQVLSGSTSPLPSTAH